MFPNIISISLVLLITIIKRKALIGQSETLCQVSIANVIFLFIALPGMTALYDTFNDNIYTRYVMNT